MSFRCAIILEGTAKRLQRRALCLRDESQVPSWALRAWALHAWFEELSMPSEDQCPELRGPRCTSLGSSVVPMGVGQTD